jgi:hypothetical protein
VGVPVAVINGRGLTGSIGLDQFDEAQAPSRWRCEAMSTSEMRMSLPVASVIGPPGRARCACSPMPRSANSEWLTINIRQ